MGSDYTAAFPGGRYVKISLEGYANGKFDSTTNSIVKKVTIAK
jgi:hypothetical protein